MAIIDPKDEKEVREKIKIRAQKPGVLGAGFPVFTKRPHIESDADLVKKIGVKNGQIHEYKYLSIELVADDSVEGEDNCPGIKLTYRLHLFVSFYDSRPAGSPWENSQDEFNERLILLRNEFDLSDRMDYDSKNITSDPLERESFIIVDDDPLTGIGGHYIDKTLAVEIF